MKSRSSWQEDEIIKRLKFSNKWTKSFLNRGNVTRRKITREDKAVPSDDEIHEILNAISRKDTAQKHASISTKQHLPMQSALHIITALLISLEQRI